MLTAQTPSQTPSQKIEPTLPEEMLMAMNQFTQFHEAINNGSRRLTWHVRAC